jgi:hypothetical protein
MPQEARPLPACWTSTSPTSHFGVRQRPADAFSTQTKGSRTSRGPNVAARYIPRLFLFRSPSPPSQKLSFRSKQADFLFPSRSCGMVGLRSEESLFLFSPSAYAQKILSRTLSGPVRPNRPFLPFPFRHLYLVCTSSSQLISSPRVMLCRNGGSVTPIRSQGSILQART